MSDIIERSFEKITKPNLRRLLQIAREDRGNFFRKHPRWRKLYAKRVICVALCQGAAQHYVDGKNGVKDFDIWTFFSEQPSAPYPYRRIGRIDYGKSKFGVHPGICDVSTGRRVDLIGRSLKVPKNCDPVEVLQYYLANPKTKTAKELSKKSVVLLEPEELFGVVVWKK